MSWISPCLYLIYYLSNKKYKYLYSIIGFGISYRYIYTLISVQNKIKK